MLAALTMQQSERRKRQLRKAGYSTRTYRMSDGTRVVTTRRKPRVGMGLLVLGAAAAFYLATSKK